MVRWTSEPRRTPTGEERCPASFSRLRMACSRVIYNDDTLPAKASQYILRILRTNCSNDCARCRSLAGAVSRDEGNVRLDNQPRTAPMKTRTLPAEF